MLLWSNFVTPQHFPIIAQLKKVGFDGIEVTIGDGDKEDYARVGKFVRDLEMGITAVTALSEGANIVSTDASVRKAGLEHIKWAIDMAHEAGIKIIGGPFHSAFAWFTRKPPSEDEVKWSVENLRTAGEYAAEAEIVLVPEVLNRFECYLVNTMASMKSLLAQIDHPNVQAMYDTHHAHIEEKDQGNAVRTIAPYLKHVHVSENDRGTPGKGQVHWDEVFTALKEINYDGWITIEAFSTIIPEFAYAINVWRDFSAAEEIYTEGFKFIKEKLSTP